MTPDEREPDPDLAALIAAALQDFVLRCCEGELSSHHVEVLRQRTFLHLPGPSSRRALSACLARLHRVGHDHLVLFLANRPEGDDRWHVAGFNGGGRYPETPPYFGYSLVSGGAVLVVGTVVKAPNVARLRVTLGSGHAYEDRVANDALLLLVPMSEPAQWRDEAHVQLFDQGGRELASQRLWVSAEAPPAPS